MTRLVPVSLALALMAGCGGGSPDEGRAPPPVEDTVFGDTVGTMDRARAVQDLPLQQKRELDAAIEQSERGAASP